MAKRKKGTQKRTRNLVDPRIRAIQAHVGPWWRVAAVIAAIGSITMIVGCSTTAWLVHSAITYYYTSSFLFQSRVTTQHYAATEIGLYLTWFNGGATVQPLQNKVNSICSGYTDLAAQSATAGLVNLWDGQCSANCVGHFQVRCNVYKQLATIGFVVVTFVVAAAALSLLASIWLFAFGKSPTFLQFGWLGSGLVAAAVIGYWMVIAKLQMDQLQLLSIYPPWKYGYSLILALVGCFLTTMAGLIACILALKDAREEWNIKQENIAAKEIEAGGIAMPAGYGLPQPGMIGMAQQNPAAMGRGFGGLGGRGMAAPPTGMPQFYGSGGGGGRPSRLMMSPQMPTPQQLMGGGAGPRSPMPPMYGAGRGRAGGGAPHFLH